MENNMFSFGDLITPNLSAYSSLYDSFGLGENSWFSPTDQYDNVSGNSGEYQWSPDALGQMADYQFSQQVDPNNMNIWTNAFKNGKNAGSWQTGQFDKNFDTEQRLLGSLMTGAGVGPLSGLFGGGVVGNTLAGGLMGAVNAAGTGGDVGKGAITGSLGAGINSGVQGFNPAGQLGISNPAIGQSVNASIGGFLKALGSGTDPLKAGLLSGVTDGITQAGRSFFNQPTDTSSGFAQPSGMSFASNASYPEGVSPGATEPSSMLATLTGQEPQQYPSTPADPSMGFGPSVSNVLSDFTNTREQATSSPSGEGGFNLSSLPQFAQNAINWGSNNLGDVAGGLYSMYTQRKNMKNLKSQMAGLQGLYDSNGAYAKQLRRTLERKDAAGGRRSDYAGRETQLMAALANGAAQTAPGLFQMQNAQSQMRNQRLVDMMRLGQRSGLFDMFKTPTQPSNVFTGGLTGNGLSPIQMPDWMSMSLSGVPGG